MIMSFYSTWVAWRREVAAERLAAAYGEDVALGIG
jgi:hypothetical protein